MMKYFVILLLLFIWFNKICSQNQFIGTPYIQTYLPKEYDANNQNWTARQDKNGVMYFGNGNGLLRYDGTNWKIFKLPNETVVRSIEISTDEKIYVSGQSEIGYFSEDSIGNLKYLSLVNYIPEKYKQFGDAWRLILYKDSIVFHTRKYMFTKCLSNTDSFSVFSNNKIIHKIFFTEGVIYARIHKFGLVRLEKDSFVLVPGGEFFSEMFVMNVLSYDIDNLLICCRNDGLFFYNKRTKEIKKVLPSCIQIDESTLYQIIRLRNNHFLFSSFDKGIIETNQKLEFVRYIDDTNGLPTNNVIDIYEDSFANIWTCHGNGISYIVYNSPFTRYTEKNGYEGVPYNSIINNNLMYLGTSVGLYYKDFNSNFKKFNNIDGQIWQLGKFNNDIVCAGSIGVLFFHNTTSKYYFSENLNFWNILPINERFFVSGTFNQGLALFEYQKNNIQFKRYIKGYTGVTRFAVKDNDLTFWISDPLNGIFKLFLTNELDSFASINFYDEAKGLPSNIKNYIAKLEINGRTQIVAATLSGVYRYNPETDLFIPDTFFYEIKNKGPIDIIQQAPNGDIWYQLEHNKMQYKGYYKLTEHNTYQHIRIPLLKLKSEYAENINFDTVSIPYLATAEGIIRYNINFPSTTQTAYKVLLTKIFVKDSIIFSGKKSMENYVIPYKSNIVKFEFSSLFFEDSDKNRYSYFLENFDSDWSEWTYNHTKEYTNLREGNYKFKVKSINIYDQESEAAIFEFTIEAPWYRAWWAYFAYFILAVCLFYIVVIIYTRKIKSEKIKLEKLVSERTAEINIKSIMLEQQKEEIRAQAENLEETNILLVKRNHEILHQKEELDKKNQNITASIFYASRIQTALLSSEDVLQKHCRDYFVFFQPRDIVSGDFYWFKFVDHYLIIAAADCTGHGVPGAFMSMLGISLLNEIIRYKEITAANVILNQMRDNLKNALNQNVEKSDTSDGMDVALCMIDIRNLSCQYAGAYNPMYVFRKDSIGNCKLLIVEADKIPVGNHPNDNKKFNNQVIQLFENDSIYLFSDGYVSQFGGLNREKYKIGRFKELLLSVQNFDMKQQKLIIENAFNGWKGDTNQIDDVLIIGIKV